jgi:hypothetical protein
MSRPKACAAIRATPAQRRLLFCASAPARQTPTTKGKAFIDYGHRGLRRPAVTVSATVPLLEHTYLTTSVLSSRLWFHRPDQPVQD